MGLKLGETPIWHIKSVLAEIGWETGGKSVSGYYRRDLLEAKRRDVDLAG